MRFSVLVFSALRNIKRNKRISFLTMLGIIIGIASVITIVSLGEGFKNRLVENFTGEHDGKVTVEAMFTPTDTRNNSSSDFNNKDRKIVEGINGVESVEYKYSSEGIGEMISCEIQGFCVQGFLGKVKKTDSANIIGRNLDERDNNRNLRTIVINDNLVKDKVKNKEDLVGSVMTINGIGFEVVGIINTSEDISGTVNLSDIKMPENTYYRYFKSNKVIRELTITISDGNNVSELIKSIENNLNKAGSRSNEGKYSILDTSGLIKVMGVLLNSVTGFIAGVAGISLFIAGIGVMNMIYTSVSERKLEIGIKRSIGAKKGDIKKEFLVEGIVITVVGGIIGYILGIIIANIISAFMNMLIIPSFFTGAIAIGISITIGMLSSIIPANKAANTNTIDILK